MTIQAADEGQALVDGVDFQWAKVRDGDIVSEGRIEIPENYYATATAAAIEQVNLARAQALRDLPPRWSQHVVRLLTGDKVVRHQDAQHAEVIIANALYRALDEMAIDARDRVSRRFPMTLRSLIPLIRRKESQ